jgi:hypothetical protein
MAPSLAPNFSVILPSETLGPKHDVISGFLTLVVSEGIYWSSPFRPDLYSWRLLSYCWAAIYIKFFFCFRTTGLKRGCLNSSLAEFTCWGCGICSFCKPSSRELLGVALWSEAVSSGQALAASELLIKFPFGVLFIFEKGSLNYWEWALRRVLTYMGFNFRC